MFLHAADFGNHYGNLVHINNYIKQGILPNADAINSNNDYYCTSTNCVGLGSE